MRDKKAVALRKERKCRVVGKGRGYIAQKIIEVAKEHDIPIKEDEELVERLFGVELYENIPEELYEHVVKVLEFLYNIKKQ